MNKILIITFLLLALAGCDCRYEATGFVYDETTKKPVSGVAVELYLAVPNQALKDQYRVFTDEKGAFDFMHEECADYDLQFSKEGYIDYLKKQGGTMTVYLEKSGENDSPKLLP